jgi:membrane-bound ClpP family serine protease
MNGRLILAITSTMLEEAVVAVIVLWGLPKWDIWIPLWALILALIGWTAFSIIIYRMGSSALRTKQTIGLHNMIGSKGEVVSPLAPEGMVRIKGELWRARSDGSEMKEGIEVIVVGQDRLELIVEESNGVEMVGRGD